MTVSTLTRDQLPKAKRIRVSPIKLTKDWQDTVSGIANLEAGRVLQVELDNETLKLGKSVPERFRRLLQAELAQGDRVGLKVIWRGKDERGVPVLYVVPAKM
jgi:hypothetical protein